MGACVIGSNAMPSMLAARRICERTAGVSADASLRVRMCVAKGMCMTALTGELGTEFGRDSGGQLDFSRSAKMLHCPSEDTTMREFLPVFVMYKENQWIYVMKGAINELYKDTTNYNARN
jgi:hypothetical protein